jgi:large subunit ribosomal protein L35
VTASGRLRRQKAGHRHLLTSKTRKRKRRLRQDALVHPDDEKKLKKLLPYA